MVHAIADSDDVTERLAEQRERLRIVALSRDGQRDEEPSRPRPVIDISDKDLERSAAAGWEAIVAANEPPRQFIFGTLPVRIERDPTTNRPFTQELTVDRLRNEAARAAVYVNSTERGAEPAAPPVGVIRDMLAERRLPLPALRTITEVPIFAVNGSLSQCPGYHADGQLYYAPRAGFTVPPIPEAPSQTDIAASRSLLLDDLLGDFPFVGPAERAHAVALLLAIFARQLINGPTPLILIEKPTPGTGATLLVDLIATIATGRPAEAMTEGRDEDEWRKRLTSKLRDSPRLVFIDNLRAKLDSSALAAAITTRVWQDRLLGTSTVLRLPVDCCWVASGNNPVLSSELTRRSVSCRLDAKMEQPWTRAKFRHQNIQRWVEEQRGALVAASLMLIQAWLTEGRPAPKKPIPFGMFEGWAETMGGILEVAGIPGLLTNRANFYARADTEGDSVRAFLDRWWERYDSTPVTVAQLFVIATAEESTLDLTAKSEQGQKVLLGKLLAGWEGRRYRLGADLTVAVKRTGEKAKGAVLWQLAQASLDTDSPDASTDDEATSGESAEDLA